MIGMAHDGRFPPFLHSSAEMLYFGLSTTLISVAFIVGGLSFRRSRDTHKRLMLLATFTMLEVAIDRFIIRTLGPTVDVRLICTLIVLALAALGAIYDWKRERDVHPAWSCGAGVFIVALLLERVVPHTALWQAIAAWVLRA